MSRDLGGFMKLTNPFNAFRNATSDMWRSHDFNYKLRKEAKEDFWKQEYIDHSTSVHCKMY